MQCKQTYYDDTYVLARRLVKCSPGQDRAQAVCNIFTWLYWPLCRAYVMGYCSPMIHYSALRCIEYSPFGG
eukprot:8803112-Ditylum_brightwellii.AAC.1